MYGLLLEGIYYYIKTIFGETVLNQITSRANIKQSHFNAHKVKYDDTCQ